MIAINQEDFRGSLTVLRGRVQLAQRHLADGEYEALVRDLIAIGAAEQRMAGMLQVLAAEETAKAVGLEIVTA